MKVSTDNLNVLFLQIHKAIEETADKAAASLTNHSSADLIIYPDKGTVLGYHFKYEYDQFGNKIRDVEAVGEYRSLGFERYQTEVTKYDKYQNIKVIEYLTQSGSTIKVISKQYSYDNTGNWTTMEISEGKSHDDLKLTEIVTRKIEYYQ